MDMLQAKRIIEGLLFVSDLPVSLKRFKEIIGELETTDLRDLVSQLNDEYTQTQRAFRIQEIAGGYQMATDASIAPWMKKALTMPKENTLSKPAMETLAIIAYRQPLTKADVELIRGVDAGGTIDTLLERQFIRVVGRKDTPGHPILYGTTDEFLQHFGLKDVQSLPQLPSDLTESGPSVVPIVPPKPEVQQQIIPTTEEKPSDAPAASPTDRSN